MLRLYVGDRCTVSGPHTQRRFWTKDFVTKEIKSQRSYCYKAILISLNICEEHKASWRRFSQKVCRFFFLCWRILNHILVCLSWSCDPKGLIFHLCWTSFCFFNPHLAAFVNMGRQNGLPKEDNLSCPPVEDCKEVKITHSPAWASTFLGTFARIK